MTGLGDRLKEARTAKGFTLDDLQSITKIQKRYLSGIENEEYSIMPGSFYVRAFIKQYAEAVGLDSDEMLLLYKDNESVVDSEEEKKQHVTPALNRRKITGNSNRFSEIMPKITVALFIIVIVVVFYFLFKNAALKKTIIDDVSNEDPITMQDSKKPIVEPDEEEKVEDEVEPEPDPEPEKVEQILTHLSMTGENSFYTLENADKFILEIRTNGDSWIGILDENKEEWMTPARSLTSGETVEFDLSGTSSIRIRVGRTQSTEIYVNGELLEYSTDRVTQNILIEYKKEQ